MKIELGPPKNSKRRNPNDPVYSTQRGLFVGAAIGLFLSLNAIRTPPTSAPDALGIVVLVFMATGVTIGLRALRGSVRKGTLLRELIRSAAFYALALLALEGRYFVYSSAGPIVATIFTTSLGALTGYVWVTFGGSIRNIGEVPRDEQER
jgi:hypothetical protein